MKLSEQMYNYAMTGPNYIAEWCAFADEVALLEDENKRLREYLGEDGMIEVAVFEDCED